MEDSPAQSPVNFAEKVRHGHSGQRSRRPTHSRPEPKSSQCRQCGLTWPHTKNPCLARGKTCNSSGKPNHFAKMCLSSQKTVHPHGQRGLKRTAPIERETPDDDLVDALNGATAFSKLDLRSGYHQLSLAPENRYVTIVATHKGLRRCTRLNFSTNSASETFQHIISEQIGDIPGSINISDDIIVFGRTKQAHNQALHAVLRRFADAGLTGKVRAQQRFPHVLWVSVLGKSSFTRS